MAPTSPNDPFFIAAEGLIDEDAEDLADLILDALEVSADDLDDQPDDPADPAASARRSREAQGLPATVEDAAVLQRLARLVVRAERRQG